MEDKLPREITLTTKPSPLYHNLPNYVVLSSPFSISI